MRENLFSEFLNTDKAADQPAHPRSPISAFVVRLLESIMSKIVTSKFHYSILASLCN